MRFIKIFIAGMAFPSFLIPFLLLFAWLAGRTEILAHPFIHFIPLIWGVWNILYFTWLEGVLPGDQKVKLLLTGGILGLLIAILAVFVFDAPMLLGLPQSVMYLPLIIAPIVYAVIWLYAVDPINRLLGVYESWISKIRF